MHLKSLTLKGFKSFPDRTRLDFGPGVSVIVGPNGSGKSNVTDAVLWAMGEQSPLAVRGQSMRDVIFGGGRGVQARASAEVELVIDNADGALDVPMGEISILRRLDRSGEGEYRLNGARCRLVDVLEVLSDTGLGKEMHSVVSQGRVETIVTSKPKERRLLIEEAAGLGKHRKRRRRAQLKLERTQDNLDRALDVEREARSRLRPLKRQAEAAELHERLERQTVEARWELVRDVARARRADLVTAEAAAAAARAAREQAEAELAEVSRRRQEADEALAARSEQREAFARRVYTARSAAERVELRLDRVRGLAGDLAERIERRERELAVLEAGDEHAAADRALAEAGRERVAALEAELERLAADHEAELERELAELETVRAQAAELVVQQRAEVERCSAALAEAEAAAETARNARRAADRSLDAARREAARVGAELAACNQFLRTRAGATGARTARSLADALEVKPGLRACGRRSARRPAAGGTRAGRARGRVAARCRRRRRRPRARDGRPRSRAGAPGASTGTRRAPPDGLHRRRPARARGRPQAAVGRVGRRGDPQPAAGLRRHRDDARRSRLARPPSRAAPGAGGRRGPRARRAQPPRGADRRERGGGAGRARRARRRARSPTSGCAPPTTSASRPSARGATRRRAFAAAEEDERRATWLIAKRREAPLRARRPCAARRSTASSRPSAASPSGPSASGPSARAGSAGCVTASRPIARWHRLQSRLVAALEAAAGAIAARVELLEAELQADRAAGEDLAARQRACATEEAEIQRRLRERGDAVTAAEVRAQQVRDQAAEADHELALLAERLGLPAEPAEAALAPEEVAALHARVERLVRRREQLGPVNPLAKDEYEQALEHVSELEAQREDLETALRELRTLIRDTDRQINETFETTFNAAARELRGARRADVPGRARAAAARQGGAGDHRLRRRGPRGRGRGRRPATRPTTHSTRPSARRRTCSASRSRSRRRASR